MMPKIVCHRGANRLAPENTFASLEAAVRLGGDVVELDIHTSRDGVLYVIHDETVDRTTNGTGRVADLTSAELDALDAGSWFSEDFAGEPIPRLDAFLKACAGRIAVYAEIKAADPVAVRDLMAANGLLDTGWSFSFDPAIRAAVRDRTPDLRLMVLLRHLGSVAAARDDWRASILEFTEHDFDAATVAEAKARGLVTEIFYDGSDEAVIEAALAVGIEQFNVDRPDLVKTVAERRLAALDPA